MSQYLRVSIERLYALKKTLWKLKIFGAMMVALKLKMYVIKINTQKT